MNFYCGVASVSWNGYTPQPGPYACVSPVSKAGENGIKLPKSTAVIQDSGAFSDSWDRRISFQAAYERQKTHAEKHNYSDQVEAVASYDLLIDEIWTEGVRIKKRWSEDDAWAAVRETVHAAKWLSENSSDPAVLSAQGVSPKQYEICTLQILEHLNPEKHIFGLGGWCICGLMPKIMMPPFAQTLVRIFPHLAEAKIKRVHIWGVVAPEFTGRLLWIADQYNIEVSTDSCGPQLSPTRGDWGYRGWPNRRNRNLKKFKKKQMALARSIHTCQVRQYLKHELRESEYYIEPLNPRFKPRNQLRLI